MILFISISRKGELIHSDQKQISLHLKAKGSPTPTWNAHSADTTLHPSHQNSKITSSKAPFTFQSKAAFPIFFNFLPQYSWLQHCTNLCWAAKWLLYTYICSFFFKLFFLFDVDHFLKSWICICIMFWFFGHEACGILTPRPGNQTRILWHWKTKS